MESIRSYKELRVYVAARDAAMRIFDLRSDFQSKNDTPYDQIRRASRSVCANIGEGWRKRRYRAHFVSS